MTEKQFIIDDAGTLINMETRKTYDYVSDVCELLNELHEENQSLKDDASLFITTIEKENEKLKEENKLLANDSNLYSALVETDKYNERLKEENRILKNHHWELLWFGIGVGLIIGFLIGFYVGVI